MRSTLSFLALFCLLMNCDNEPLQSVDNNQELIVQKIQYPFIDASSECPGRAAHFDPLGKITSVTYECNGSISTLKNYFYSDTGLITGFSNHLDFQYDENNRLISRSGGSDTSALYSLFTYEGPTMREQSYTNDLPNSSYTLYEFSDASFTQLLSIVTIDTALDNAITYRETITYDGLNPTEILIESQTGSDTELTPKTRYTATYDNGINPYRKGLSANGYIAKSTTLAFDSEFRYTIIYTAANNIVQLNIENFVTNVTTVHSNTYTYNAFLYPTSLIYSIDGVAQREGLFEYYD